MRKNIPLILEDAVYAFWLHHIALDVDECRKEVLTRIIRYADKKWNLEPKDYMSRGKE